jgi:hypothetical protein
MLKLQEVLMKVRTIGMFAVVGVAMSMSPVWAGSVGVEPALTAKQEVTLNQLEARREQVGQNMPEPPKGAAIGHWLSKRVQLDDLIGRLKKGEPVSPKEIDQAMGPTNS